MKLWFLGGSQLKKPPCIFSPLFAGEVRPKCCKGAIIDTHSSTCKSKDFPRFSNSNCGLVFYISYFLYACAAQLRARQAKPAEFYIRYVTSGLCISPYLVSTPATPEIYVAALLWRSVHSPGPCSDMPIFDLQPPTSLLTGVSYK